MISSSLAGGSNRSLSLGLGDCRAEDRTSEAEVKDGPRNRATRPSKVERYSDVTNRKGKREVISKSLKGQDGVTKRFPNVRWDRR